jgi:hypothetical protein
MIPLLVPIGLGLIGGYLSQDSTETFAGGGGVGMSEDWTFDKMRNLWRDITGNPNLDVKDNPNYNAIYVDDISPDDQTKLATYYKGNSLFFNMGSRYLPNSKTPIFTASMYKSNLISFEKNGKKWVV